MAVLIVLFASWVAFRCLGAFGITIFATWHASALYALAVMFVFTSIAHFNKMKHELAPMVPAMFSQPMLMIHLTGICELLGAVGLIIPRIRAVAAIALIVMLIALFPANIKAARLGLTLGGKPVTPLWLRAPMQVLFIGLLWWAGLK
jgi:uncharacterized membrane protein